jgi:hypothetical protein
MSTRSELARIRLRWTPRRVALEVIYRLQNRQLDGALYTSLLARMKSDIERRFHPSQAGEEYASAVKQFLFLIQIYAAAICPLLEAMAEAARLVTSTLMLVEFGQIGPRGRLTVLVDALNQMLLRVAIMDKILVKHGLSAAVPRFIQVAVCGLGAHVLLTCRLLTEKKLEGIGLLDCESLVQQAEDDLAPLQSTARQAAGETKLDETARSICDKEVTVVSRFTDWIVTSEVVYEDWRQQIDNLERARQKPRRQTRGPKARIKRRTKARSKPKRKPPLHRTGKR